MGNKSNHLRASKKAQAKKILPSGEIGGFGGNYATPGQDKSLRIRLVYLDLKILNRCNVNDPVKVFWLDEAFQCLVDSQILGRIPSNYNRQLSTSNVYHGAIIQLKLEQSSVIIEISI